jgi:phage baseplate assembly protein W
MIYTPSFPLSFDDTYGYQNVQGAKELIRFHLINLLFTNPGEKISNSNFGVGIRQYLFENFNDQILPNIELRIEDQIQSYLSYLRLMRVVAIPNPENDNVLQIQIVYSVSGVSEPQMVNLDIDINQGIVLDNNYY